VRHAGDRALSVAQGVPSKKASDLIVANRRRPTRTRRRKDP
jgi:hypothetical protein